jgi:pantothenate kinase
MMNTSSPPPTLPAAARARVDALLSTGQRCLLGLVGPPGAGKSTLAQLLQGAYPEHAQVVPMDGFHLANAELQRLGRAQRKGAPDTFDSAGYVELLLRLRRQRPNDAIVYAPLFRRDLEEPLAGAIAVQPATRLVITEGNYLLDAQDGWGPVATLLDETWYVAGNDAVRTLRLLRRHESFGRTPEQARAWLAQTDDPNARRIAATRDRAGWLFTWDAAAG